MGGYWYVDSQPYSAVLDALIAASNSSQIVLTTGTYSDPGFIASLAASKITGTLAKSQQHAQTAYKDQANTWAQAQTIQLPNDALITGIVATFGGIYSGAANPAPVEIRNGGLQNLGIGFESLSAVTSGVENVSIGYRALRNNTTGYENTAVGHSALRANTTGGLNASLGYLALDANTTGGEQTALGALSLSSNTTGSQNTAIGFRALASNTTGDSNVAIGHETLYLNTTGGSLIAIGRQALYNNTTGAGNLSIGDLSLRANTTGFRNVSIGSESMLANTTGAYNVSVGWNALKANIDADDNTAIGYSAMSTTTTGDFNTAVGYRALDFNTTGSYNTAIGWEAGARISGFSTTNTTGSNSVFIGRWASPLADGQTNQIVIGYEAVGAGSNTVTLGNASIVSTILRGDVSTTGSFDSRVAYIRNNGGTLKITIDGPNERIITPLAYAQSVYVRNTSDASTIELIGQTGAGTFNGTLISLSTGKLGDYTVATLPSAASNAGHEANVTDSSVTTFGSTVAGSGSSRVKVYSNGTNWTVQAA